MMTRLHDHSLSSLKNGLLIHEVCVPLRILMVLLFDCDYSFLTDVLMITLLSIRAFFIFP